MDALLKRLIIILGGKGGTGKTGFASTLLYALTEAGVKFQGYDADDENPIFSDLHPDRVQELNLFDASVAREFFVALDQQGDERPPVILLDMPGASGNATREQMERFKFLKLAEMMGYRLTVCTVLNLDVYGITSLDTMMDFCGDGADYVVVKNQIWTKDGGRFDKWEKSSTRKRLLPPTEEENTPSPELSGIEIELPPLEPVVFKRLRDDSLGFLNYEALGIPDFLIVESFLDLAKIQLEEAAPFFGLPVPATPKSKKQTTRRTKKKANPGTPPAEETAAAGVGHDSGQ